MEDRCVCCGEVIPEGRMICLQCEHMALKVGAILQSRNATNSEVKKAYESLCEGGVIYDNGRNCD